MKEWAKQKSYKYTSKNENNRQQIELWFLKENSITAGFRYRYEEGM